jgi:zinc transport system substrate-binding protein
MKKLILLFIVCILSLTTSGCFKRDTMEDIQIYTSVYPVEYIVNQLYGKHATITSIYPDGVDFHNYHLTSKQVKDYSKGQLFIYNGLSKEADYAVSMVNQNKNIKIIDISMGTEYTNEIEELWLNPSNLLMLSQNIRNGFHEYISNPYLNKEIDRNYDELKLAISELDAEIKLTVEDASNKTIVVSNDLFKYLEIYGLNVISLEDNNNLTDRIISDVQTMISNNQIKYIYMKKGETPNNTIKNLIQATNVQTKELNTISTITEQQRLNKEDYITLTKGNIDLIKLELYK